MTEDARQKIVVTRPLAQASPLAERIVALGRTVVVFPLLDILPLADREGLRQTLRELHRYALIAFVSPNAIDAAFAECVDWPPAIPLAVVGEGSRQALARHGVTDANHTIIRPTDCARTDSETLLAELDLAHLRGEKVLIIRGETGRELMADALRAAGVEVTTVVAYRRAAPLLTAEHRSELQTLLEGLHEWIITSSEALRVLINMVAQLEQPGLVAKMQQQRIIVPHLRIEETARALGFESITLTRSGDDGLLSALQSSHE